MFSGRCAACRNQRRKCPPDCIFSPYFPANDPQKFTCVHQIYGGSRVGRLLQEIPSYVRAEAADTMYLEAQCRIEDPVYGCVRIISELCQQINNTEKELARVQALIALHKFHLTGNGANHPNLDVNHYAITEQQRPLSD